jgi:hypothetical protein
MEDLPACPEDLDGRMLRIEDGEGARTVAEGRLLKALAPAPPKRDLEGDAA